MKGRSDRLPKLYRQSPLLPLDAEEPRSTRSQPKDREDVKGEDEIMMNVPGSRMGTHDLEFGVAGRKDHGCAAASTGP